MKNLTQNLFAKITAYFLLIIFISLGALNFYALEQAYHYNLYPDHLSSTLEEFEQNFSSTTVSSSMHNIYTRFMSNSRETLDFDELFEENSYYTLEENYEIIAQNLYENHYDYKETFYTPIPHASEDALEIGTEIQISQSLLSDENRPFNTSTHSDQSSYFIADDGFAYFYEELLEGKNGEVFEVTYDKTFVVVNQNYMYTDGTLTVYLTKEYFTDEDNKAIADELSFATLYYNYRYAILVSPVVLGILSLLTLAFLIASAGKKKGVDGIYLNVFNKLPFDIYIGIYLIALSLMSIYFYFNYFFIGAAMIVFSIISLPLILMSFVARVKYGKWWRNTIIYMIILRPCLKLLKWIFSPILYMLKYVKKNISSASIVIKGAILGVSISVLSLIFFVFGMLFGYYFSPLLFIVLLFFIVVLTSFFVLLSIWQDRLLSGAKNIASGDFKSKVDTDMMFLEFREFADVLNNIGDGMKISVQEKLKSERLKTELITNVSHDIKTPLTSIINYVDLIKKENVDNKVLSEYVNVLDRQSNRLKNLITDLVDASKISSGNIKIDLERTDICVMTEQIEGEYIEKFSENQLTLISTYPSHAVNIMADSNHLHRIFDNLMNNALKYSQNNSRVYLDVKCVGDDVLVEFKNISKQQLNMDISELLERFTRGDESRNTEGNGLGLSIAQSLVHAQHGVMDISIDGDLFKVSCKFKALSL